MEQRFILSLLSAALLVSVAPGVKGTSHLSFANNTEVNITRAGCTVSKLCVETPDDCDPAGTSSVCLFGSVAAGTPQAPNGSDLSIQARGNSMGYIALGLTVNASEGTTMLFICAQNSSDNGTFFFRTVQRNNTDNSFTLTEKTVTEIRGMAKNDVIQCEFNVPNVNATNTRSSHDTTFSILMGNGSFNGTSFGPFTVSLNSRPLNLLDPDSNVPTPAPTPTPTNSTTPTPTNSTTPTPTNSTTPTPTNSTTPTPTNSTTPTPTNSTTPSGARSLFHSHALPVLLTVLTLAATQRV